MFTNYRPVSLLPQFSKIPQNLYNDGLEKFLNKYDVLSPSQYGFRSNMSLYHVLSCTVGIGLRNALDNKKYAIGVFVDLRKAFDTVDYDILAKKIAFLWCA